MKKTIYLILTLVLCLHLCACGGGENTTSNTTETTDTSAETTDTEASALTKDELLTNAVSITNDEISSAMSNPAYAKTLVGKTYIIYGKVWNIEFDHVVISFIAFDENGNTIDYVGEGLQVRAYLPEEELITATLESKVTIVCEITGAEKMAGGTALIAENAYFVDSTLYIY